jgi:3-methyl-2-oxobutanoate hydroxymethyltransferase
VKRAFFVADMPYASYHVGVKEALRNATKFVKYGGAEAVKLEGGSKRIEIVTALVDAEIPVMGHIGLTPQSVNAMGGYKVQGKSLAAIENLMRDAVALDNAGVCSIVLEGIPREVAAMITAEVSVPTIGIGAGPECDGQVLVIHDLIGMTFTSPAKFVRRYAAVGTLVSEAIGEFKKDVVAGNYPSDAESYHLPKETAGALEDIVARKKKVVFSK